MMSMIWIVIQVFVGYNLALPLVLYWIWKSKKPVLSTESEAAPENDYAIIVTAFQQTALLPVVIKSLLKLNYSNYLIYIVADNCDTEALHFDDERVVLLAPPVVLASNTRSHFYAIDRFIRPHERLTIIDSDNLVDPDYLKQLDFCFSRGFQAVQGIRKAKNLDTTVACLDATRDLYYHFYDGKILFQLNSSATLAGSGMAFTTQLYKDCLGHLDITGAGFDKVLQAAIVGKDLRIAFTDQAIVYDEKTSKSSQLVNQRARWINTWFKYFKFGFQLFSKGIKNGSINQVLFGLTLLRPPLFMFILLSGLFLLVNLFTSLSGSMIWIAAFVAFIISFYIALQHSNADSKIYKSLKGIPKFIFFQLLSLSKSKNANKTSIATTHYHKHTNEDI